MKTASSTSWIERRIGSSPLQASMAILPRSRRYYYSTRTYERPVSSALRRRTDLSRSRRLLFYPRTKFLSKTSYSTAGDIWLHIKFQGPSNFAASYRERFLARRSIGFCARKSKEEEERLPPQHIRAS